MNRRTFLRSIATICGAAVVCPGELVKPPTKHLWMRGKGGAYIEGEICYGKHGRHCCCNSCVDDIMTDCLPPLCELIQATLRDLPKREFPILPDIDMEKFYR